MTLDEFWRIVDATIAPEQNEQLERFRDALRRLNAADLVEFQKLYTEQFFNLFSWDIWLVAWLFESGRCSDDSFMDFRSWLLSRGHAIFQTALAAPDELVAEIRSVEYPYFESFGYVPAEVYRARIGEEIPGSTLQHPQQPTGGNWLRSQLKDRSGSKILNLCVVFNEMGSEEFAAIERQFPKTWAYCLERGIIKPAAEQSASAATPPGPEKITANVHENLAKTDFAAYLSALKEAAKQTYGGPKNRD